MQKSIGAIALLSSSLVFAQTTVETAEKKEKSPNPYALKTPDFKIEPYAQLQGWAVYSMDRSAQNDNDVALDKADPRLNFFFRRARIGFRGKPYKNLSYQVSLYYDNAGHDSQAATRATTLPAIDSNGKSAGGPATVGVWDSILSWKVSDTSDMYHVTFGYFRPQISRESITAAFNVNSFEKAPSQNYVRQAVIGRGFGRGTGINLGGLSEGGFNYNLGIFNKVTNGETVNGTVLGETQGSDSQSLVYVGRAAWTFGDKEMDKYGLSYNINYFGKRKGLTVALSGSTQDRTPKYSANDVVGGDMLFNWGPWQVDGEFFYIYKKNRGAKDYSRARTGHLRGGYNFFLANGTVLEPALMVSGFYGEEGSDYTGRDLTVDVGLNWYLDQNRYKFYVHYVKQDGDGNNLVHKEPSGTNVNVGYDYGDYAGVGLTLQI